MTSTLHDPHYFPELVTYLIEPIDGAKYGGGNHGGTTEPDNGATPMETTARHKKARMSFHGLRRTYRTRFHGLRWREVPQPR